MTTLVHGGAAVGPRAARLRAARRTERRVATHARVALIVVAALGALELLPDNPWAPLTVALVAGLPHGAVDHVLLARRLGGRVGWLVGSVGYLTAAVIAFVVAGWAPLPVWSAFVLLSVWHFGTADRETLAATAGLGGSPSWWQTAAAGAIPVGLLLVRGAEQIRPLAERLHPRVAVLLDAEVVAAVAVLVPLLVVGAVVAELRGRRLRSVGELGVLALLFLTAPPLWAFGAYFGLWHAPRHISRMMHAEAPWAAVTARQGHAAALRRFARDAAAPTMVALLAAAVLVVVGAALEPVVVTAVMLQVTAAVTFPHVATVAFLDQNPAKASS